MVIAYRRARLNDKLLIWPFQNRAVEKNPSFVWGEYKEEITIEEYIDLVMTNAASLFEIYHNLLKDKQTFNCVNLANELNLHNLRGEIDKVGNLKKLYKELSLKASSEYGITTDSIFSLHAYKVRCAYFHMDYHYEQVSQTNFTIYLNKNKTDEIKFDELIVLLKDIYAKTNAIRIAPLPFANSYCLNYLWAGMN